MKNAGVGFKDEDIKITNNGKPIKSNSGLLLDTIWFTNHKLSHKQDP